MKSHYSRLITILISCMLISCTVFFTGFDSFGKQLSTIEEEVSAKISADKSDNGLKINKINTKNVLGNKTVNNNNNDNNNSRNNNTTATSSTATSSASSTAATTRTTSSNNAKAESKADATKTTEASVPDDESKNVEYIKDPDYKSKYYIVVYTGSQSAVVYGKDNSGAYNVIIKAFTVSTGKSSTPTRKGMYKIRAKYRWRLLMGPCYGQYSSSIGSSYLFHSVPYDKQKPDTLYNASYNNLGKAVSHGCIRMCVRDCKWIFDNCPIGTQVHVVWESGPKGAGVPKRKTGAKYSGWDPSDEWSAGNPYFSEQSTTSSSKTTTTTTTTTDTTATTTTTTAAPPVSSSLAADESSDDLDGVPVG